jgi:hypothetical protein
MDIGNFLAQLPPIFPILMLAFILLIVVSLVVLLASGGKKKDKRKANDVPEPVAPPAPKTTTPAPVAPPIAPLVPQAAPPRPTGAYRMALASGESVDAVEVMVLMRDIADGRLIAQIGDRAYPCPPENADAEFMRRYAIAVRDLSAVAVDVPRSPRPAPPPAPPVPVPLPESTAPELESPLDDAPPLDALIMTADAPPAPVAGTMPGDLPKYGVPDTLEPPRLGRRPSGAPIPEINIAASIEAFLQYRLSADGRFTTRSIHVLPAGADGLRIDVDGQSVDHIDDISDPVVQAFLRQTIEEWQSRQ